MEERFEIFTVLINRISRNIRKIKNYEMAKYNLRSAHISCLYYLYRANGLTASELCEKCEEDKATISRALDYLEKNGYLSCETKNGKRYKCPIILTEKGFSIGKKIAEKIERALDELAISASLSDEERNTFYRCLSVISENLDLAAKYYDN